MDLLGKIWASPTTSLGLIAGVLLSREQPTIGSNAVEFTGVAIVGNFTSAITIGNVILYSKLNPDSSVWAHGESHTYQAQVLGIAYLPMHIASQLIGYIYSFSMVASILMRTRGVIPRPIC
jgi:hypothetical protein